ncbi:hypothetical protein ACFP1I_11320 [Dyadobacter subterraneus]|uniref:Uncharacterized protein n=1 Tax=Dyadobacter subterraneus TaxID=2773304 RepID=A0ABR9WDL1_9BACT|nr:hypothetical protein [Dyadobacter subterraneus]MBE9463510.1 hypothetical protein [Dyadobacter subterraneus]
MKKNSLQQAYQKMIDWNSYRLEQNTESLKKLIELLPQLSEEDQADPVYQADIDDLLSLKIIYETGIRNFESKIDKYNELLDEMTKP